MSLRWRVVEIRRATPRWREVKAGAGHYELQPPPWLVEEIDRGRYWRRSAALARSLALHERHRGVSFLVTRQRRRR